MKFGHKLLVGAAAAAALTLGSMTSAACGGSGGEGGGADVSDVVYAGGATDEALEALVEATLVTDPSQAATFTAPASGATVPSTPSPVFTWKVGAAPASPAPPPAPTTSLFTPPARTWSDRAASSLASLLLHDVPAAYAHGTPISGPAYFVVFSTSKDPKLLRVFTTETTYTPEAVDLAKLKAAGEAIHAVVTYAEFEENRIATDGGPFKGTEITFTLQ